MSIATQTFDSFLDSLAAKTPTPGGGAVTAAVGALAAALAGMVVAYSVGKKNLAEHQAELEQANARLAKARALMLALVEEDERAYAAVNELSRLPESDPRRIAELPQAASAATQAPLAVMAAACDLLRLFERLSSITNKHLRSDLAIAAILADAVVRAGRWNVAVNLPMLRDLGIDAGIEETYVKLLEASGALVSEVETACE